MTKRIFTIAVLFALMVGAFPAAAQTFTQVQGKAVDEAGKPLANAQVLMQSVDSGIKYSFKVNNKGEFIQVGVRPGKYDITLVGADGKEIMKFAGVPITLGGQKNDGVNYINFDLAAERARAAQQGGAQQLSAEQQKQIEAAKKEGDVVKQLNSMLKQAQDASTAGNHEQAVQILSQATQIDATRDVIWFNLGEAQRRAKQYEPAVASYQKAIQLRSGEAGAGAPAGAAAPQGGAAPAGGAANPANAVLAGYYNNMADALARTRKLDEALAAYEKATQLDPTRTSMFQFNAGATLVNSGRYDEALKKFDQVIKADPKYAEAYYQKGVTLLGKAQLDPKTGKMTAPDGTAEALNAYLEIAPNGPNAEAAKQLLATMGAEIETRFKKGKK